MLNYRGGSVALLCYVPHNPLERVAGPEVQGPLEEVLAQ